MSKQQPVIETQIALERILGAEHDREESERRNEFAADRQADGNRSGQQQPDRSPQPAPENRGDKKRDRRDANAMTDNDRLDESADELIAQNEKTEDCERDVPARKHGDREKRRQRRAEKRADVRYESHQAGDDAPERRVRNAEEKEAHADEQAEAEVKECERQQIPADAMRGLADRLRRHRQVRAPSKTQELVAHLLAFFQQEENEHHDEERSGDEFHRRRDRAIPFANRVVVDHSDVQRFFFRARRFGHALQSALKSLKDREAGGRSSKKPKLLFNALNRAALREFLRHRVELRIDPPAAERERSHGKADGKHDGAGAAQKSALKDRHDRCQQKGKENRQCDRNHNGLREIENGDDDERREKNARIRLTALGRTFIHDRSRSLGHGRPANRERPVEIVFVVFENRHAGVSLLQGGRRDCVWWPALSRQSTG